MDDDACPCCSGSSQVHVECSGCCSPSAALSRWLSVSLHSPWASLYPVPSVSSCLSHILGNSDAAAAHVLGPASPARLIPDAFSGVGFLSVRIIPSLPPPGAHTTQYSLLYTALPPHPPRSHSHFDDLGAQVQSCPPPLFPLAKPSSRYFCVKLFETLLNSSLSLFLKPPSPSTSRFSSARHGSPVPPPTPAYIHSPRLTPSLCHHLYHLSTTKTCATTLKYASPPRCLPRWSRQLLTLCFRENSAAPTSAT